MELQPVMRENPSNRSNAQEHGAFRRDLSGIGGSPAEAVVHGFPLGLVGREVDGDPAVTSDIGLVENVVERGGIVGGSGWHWDLRAGLPGRQVRVVDYACLPLRGACPAFPR